MTINELADYINENGHVTDQRERAANRAFLVGIHRQLKDGGVWLFPAAGESYVKTGEGFERVI